MSQSEHHALLTQFLSYSVSEADELFDVFAALPGAQSGRGAALLERYVYVPGTRPDRVLLVAHADTVWDVSYTKRPAEPTQLVFEDGVFRNAASDHGIGADDRAGCAMLYALRESGHSLLLVHGEEHGKKGARYLRRYNKPLFKELNRHRYMIEFDWCGTNSCLFNQVDYSDRFKKYIEGSLGFIDSEKTGGCDLQVLCRKRSGVNLGVGYHGFHTAKETLCLAEWENTYKMMAEFLQKEQPRFPVGKKRRFVSNMKQIPMYAKAAVNKMKKLLSR